MRLIEVQEDPYRALSAFIHETGAEIGAVLRMLRRDIDLDRMVAHVPGTKAAGRNRHDVVIEGWAKAYLGPFLLVHDVTQPTELEELAAEQRPIFAGITRYQG